MLRLLSSAIFTRRVVGCSFNATSSYFSRALLLKDSQIRHFSNPLAPTSYRDLVGAVTGGRGGRGGRGRRKGGKKGRFDQKLLSLGKAKIRFPGLNAPLSAGMPLSVAGAEAKRKSDRAKGKKEEIDDDDVDGKATTERRPRRNMMDGIPTMRGWSGRNWRGRSFGAPETAEGNIMSEFDSRVIELKRVANQTSAGKKRTAWALVVVGNRNGAAGFAVGKAQDTLPAMRKARNKAANFLHYVERCDDHTIYHDLKAKATKTNIVMQRAVEGTGLRCHRIIRAICEMVGIKDIHCKIIGSVNPLNIVRATFKGLESQETHQQLADRTKRHVVEFRREMGMRPVAVASPRKQ